VYGRSKYRRVQGDGKRCQIVLDTELYSLKMQPKDDSNEYDVLSYYDTD
jgi:hypothetical protein